MNEEKILINGIEIKYKFKKKKYDFNHLIVIFSGYGDVSEFTYNMDNVLQHCPCNVLWIKDDFYGKCSYYICHDLDFSIRDSVHELIERKIEELSITKENCTLAGFSKGGSAALYFGTKFNFKNIVTTVPQIEIGSFCKRSRPDTLEHMTGSHSNSIEILNNLIPESIKKDHGLYKNIYIIISPSDPDFDEQFNFLSSLRKYKNFNNFISNSHFVRGHAMVTMHHVPLILSIIYSLASGATPSYGDVQLLPDESPSKEVKKEPVVQLRNIKIIGDVIFPEGVGIIRGINCNTYGDINYKLIFKGTNNYNYEFPLAKSNKPPLTREFYKDSFYVYDKCWFCTPAFNGLNISEIQPGYYELFLELRSGNHIFLEKLTYTKKISVTSESEDACLEVNSSEKGTFLEKIYKNI